MLEIREISAGDVSVVARLVDHLLAELRGEEGGMIVSDAMVANVLGYEDRSFGFLAVEQDKPVGVLMMTEGVAIFADGAYGQITELYVAPEYRSRAVAAALVERAAEFGKSRGWRRLDVGAPLQPMWSRTLHFYVSVGFKEVGPRLRLDL
ncbi:ribosomal protein S18 acetylase RimI-like enzyme [Paraburkholderia unamae]|uniref:GNAT family N-acetyltransferase n=1 Tax=Paraburkholderia unamae TaxID=219649 RepID=UPI000DC49C74|nr:GNAT family N-acetyltransferase [Paraburkholderia unamae]RAR57135.1 ribosomal protein S18 acetylase RimI-like enzyme [Paraburkholderia unamae]